MPLSKLEQCLYQNQSNAYIKIRAIPFFWKSEQNLFSQNLQSNNFLSIKFRIEILDDIRIRAFPVTIILLKTS
jgi:hypothetical protein